MPHPTPPNPMSNVACTSHATSNQRQHAPPHPTQPYVQRSVHIRCNFKPTSTCPTPPHPDPMSNVARTSDATSNQRQHAPPHPTQPYVQRSVHIRCNFKPTSTCPTPPHPDPMSNVACTSDATSNQRQHAPPHPTPTPINSCG